MGATSTPEDYATQGIQEPTKDLAANVFQMRSWESLVKYLHQCLFSPPKRTLVKALENDQFPTRPFSKEAVKKYVPNHSPAADKGSMKRQQQGLGSTKETVRAILKDRLDTIKMKRDFPPPKEPQGECKQNHLFVTLGLLDPKDGIIYGDLTVVSP